MTLQVHIYSIIYIYNISQFNTAHNNLGTTLRIAQALRLHLGLMPSPFIEGQGLYYRIWNTLYRLDSQLLMNLDGLRRFGILIEFDDDSAEQARFHTQCTKLISTVQAAQAAFEQKCSQLLNDNTTGDIYDNPQTTETIAEFFRHKVAPPPLWLQRQRLLLELLYHHLQISILRQLLCFPPVVVSLTPLADSFGISCVYYAITITNIIHQVLAETDPLPGLFHVYQYQWDTVLCTLGFVLANPVYPPTPPARKSLQTAVQNLEIIGEHFPAAASAARLVIDEFRRSMMGRKGRDPATLSSSSSQTMPSQTITAPLSKTAIQTSYTQYLSERSTPPLTTASTDTPAIPMPMKVISGTDLQWLQGALNSWADFAV
ncbi:hypothetical protein PMAA_086800 [Talaromyces marneffei ATCC 18224]|uniref:Transcription factor domain-containing protein n=1 Tax=Talaromyces marneffei (strain ATCC 18224 / CBS 334.59 / QM 7333) TaxID=441960 RepID=B6QD01_TALMQ|nr:hypothetical protein PMAA_086800 [Talaromyces marneffei ATCC 18224]